jgi:hypothetical protein
LAKYYILICFFAFALTASAQKSTIIEGNIKSPSNGHATLALYKYINITEGTVATQNLTDSSFKFKFTLTSPAYFTLSTNKYVFKLFLIEPGDSIHIDINISNIEAIAFSGEGSDKMNYQYWAHIRYQDWYHPPANLTTDTGKRYFNYLDSCREQQLYSLKNFKGLLTSTVYQILQADVFYNFEDLKSKYVYNLFRDSTTTQQAKLLYKLYLPIQNKFDFNDTLAYSRNLINYLIQQNKVDYQYLYSNNGSNNWAEEYRLADQHLKGKILERALTILLLNENIPVADDDILKCVKDYLSGNYFSLFKDVIRRKYEL